MDEECSVKVRQKHDYMIRRLFYILVMLFIFWIIYTIINYERRDIFALLNPVLNGLITIFSIAGIVSLIFYWDTALIKTRTILKFLLGISFFLTLFTIVIGYTLYRPFLLSFFLIYISWFGSFIPIIMFFIFFLFYLF